MKKRRTVIIAALLVAALALGIGYAAVSDDLLIGGNAAISVTHADEAFEADVYFAKAIMSSDKGTATITELATGTGDNDKIYIEVADGALKGAGDSVICAIEIANTGDIDAVVTLTPAVITNDSQYFSVTTNWNNNSATVASGNVADLTVTISCIKTPLEAVDMEFALNLTADPATLLPGAGA